MLQVRFESSGDALVLTPLAPRLDAACALEFVAAVADSVQGRRVVVVSLAHVAVVDASGVAALVTLHRRLAPGGALRLLHVRPEVRALLEATFLDDLFPAYEDAAAAVRA